MNKEELERIYYNVCCDILPSSEDFGRMVELGHIYVGTERITIYKDTEPEEDQCLYRCLRDSSRLLDEHMTRMTAITKERKKIEREKRELDQRIWNRNRTARLQRNDR